MASTVLPNGIIIPEKYSRDWYADLYHNWQELDNLLGGGTPKDGTLTIQKNGSTVGTFSANQATDETINITVPTVNDGTLTIQKNGTAVGTFSANSSSDETVNIEVPDVNNGTLTIQQNGTTVDTFTANSSSDKTVNVQCVDLTSNQTVAGNKEFTGTTTAHGLVPSATGTYNLGVSSKKWKTFNGINPSALSLPGASVNVDTTNWALDGSNVSIFTPDSDGWLGIQVTDTVYDQMHYVFVGRASGGDTYYQQNVLSPINALWDSKYHGCIFIPVVKNRNYDIRCICSTIVATFYPCQGNV